MMFEQFWKQYPRKIAKKAAERVWKRMTASEREAALQAIDKHAEYWRLKETSQEFIPHPSTWLNQGRWDDELDMSRKLNKQEALEARNQAVGEAWLAKMQRGMQ